MEVSSHGLDQGRVNAVDFDVAVLTNLGRDHLDYHGDMDEYRRAKQRLFQRPELKSVVLNLDDTFGRQLAGELQTTAGIWGYGIDLQDDCGLENIVQATRVRVHGHGLAMRISAPGGEAELDIPLLGEFNVSNVLATLAVLLIKGVDFKEAVGRLQKLSTVPGRMQVVSVDHRPLVVVDYAHTPQALASVLASLRKHCAAKLFCVFGCGGDRDRGKRPLMAQAAEQYADVVLVTDDNPRSEDSAAIIADIMAGFTGSDKVDVIADRRQAIEQAIAEAQPDDIVLIAGKGHEQYQIIGQQKYPFSDRDIARACLEGGK
jgi:UDP-N-acetylmuramoyl-L-alanyl-D-glutamate--2,6-diaminopimelate ligase